MFFTRSLCYTSDMVYKQSPIGKFDMDELREVYESLSADTKAAIYARASRVAIEMRKRNASFSVDMALELMFKTAVVTQRLDLLV